MPELLALVKHDCETCELLVPALDAAASAGAPLRVLSQSDPRDTEAWAHRLRLGRTPGDDAALEVSARFDPEAVPAVLLLDGGQERGRVEGLHRERLHERGVTDGLPVVPPTPELVVAMLEHTARDPQELVGVVPPYDGRATVEKVAINAVMAGCPPEVLPVVLAAVRAACDERFAWQGLMATTHPAGPVVVASGPLALELGLNAGGNALGQGNRANLTVGR